MNTPELKVGQRFLVKLGTDIIEYSVQEIAADGKYHRIKSTTDAPHYTKWVELWNLDIIHVFEAPEEKAEWSNRNEVAELLKGAADMEKGTPLGFAATRDNRATSQRRRKR